MNRPIKFRAWDGKNMFYNVWLAEGHEAWAVAVMQFTGLTDKNGKEIFEGDIVRIPSYSKGSRMVVTYSDFYAGFTPFVEMPNAYREGCEIMGNIYESPELLAV